MGGGAAVYDQLALVKLSTPRVQFPEVMCSAVCGAKWMSKVWLLQFKTEWDMKDLGELVLTTLKRRAPHNTGNFVVSWFQPLKIDGAESDET